MRRSHGIIYSFKVRPESTLVNQAALGARQENVRLIVRYKVHVRAAELHLENGSNDTVSFDIDCNGPDQPSQSQLEIGPVASDRTGAKSIISNSGPVIMAR